MVQAEGTAGFQQFGITRAYSGTREGHEAGGEVGKGYTGHGIFHQMIGAPEEPTQQGTGDRPLGDLQRSLQLHEEARLGQRRVLGGRGEATGTHNSKASRHEAMEPGVGLWHWG